MINLRNIKKLPDIQVNRLTRELASLRQQSSSVASTSSSASASISENPDYLSNYPLFGSSHPTPSRRHRSSSSLSTRSVSNTNGTINASVGISSNLSVSTAGLTESKSSGITPARDCTGARSLSHARESLSRQNSVVSTKPSGVPSPSLPASVTHGGSSPVALQHRQSSSIQQGHISGM